MRQLYLYLCSQGDSYQNIANILKVKLADLLEYNCLSGSEPVLANQALLIPSCGWKEHTHLLSYVKKLLMKKKRYRKFYALLFYYSNNMLLGLFGGRCKYLPEELLLNYSVPGISGALWYNVSSLENYWNAYLNASCIGTIYGVAGVAGAYGAPIVGAPVVGAPVVGAPVVGAPVGVAGVGAPIVGAGIPPYPVEVSGVAPYPVEVGAPVVGAPVGAYAAGFPYAGFGSMTPVGTFTTLPDAPLAPPGAPYSSNIFPEVATGCGCPEKPGPCNALLAGQLVNNQGVGLCSCSGGKPLNFAGASWNEVKCPSSFYGGYGGLLGDGA